MRKASILVACASILQILESSFPQPFPGIRLGLANAVTVVALVELGPRAALEVAALRTVVSSFILGSFLSPTFVLSFSAALASAAAMAVVYRLVTLARRPVLSLVGISLIGSTVHNITQISLVFLLLVRHRGVFLLLPWLGISAVIMGWITGLVAAQACRRLQAGPAPATGRAMDRAVLFTEPNRLKAALQTPATSRNAVCSDGLGRSPVSANAIMRTADMDRRPPAWPSSGFESKDTPIHRFPAPVKIIGVFIMAVIVLCLRRFELLATVLLLLCATAVVGRVFTFAWFSTVRRLWLFIVFSFLVPFVFTRTGDIWCRLGPLIFTSDGVEAGSRVVWRIVLLVLSTSLLVRTTAPADLAAGLKTVLAPLCVLGISADRVAAILSASWAVLPAVWTQAQDCLLRRRPGKQEWKELIPDLGNAVAALYLYHPSDGETPGPTQMTEPSCPSGDQPIP